jgi:O-antigen ligase
MTPTPTIWRNLSEGLLLTYLLTLPAGAGLPWWAREPLLYGVVLFGVLDAAVGPPVLRLRGLVPVGVFLAVHALTIATSGHPNLSLGLSVFMPVVAAVFVVMQRVLVTREAFDRLFAVLGVVSAVIALEAAAHALLKRSLLTGRGVPHLDRVSGSLPHPNDLVLVPILLPFMFESLRARGRRWLVAGLVLIGPAVAVALLTSQSRNAWLTGAGVVFVWSWLTLGWRWALGAAGAVGLIAGALYGGDVWGARRRAGDFLRVGRDGRVGLWLVAWGMFRESPWLGKGVFTFGEYYKPSWYAFRVRFPEGYIPERGVIPWAHNLPLELLSERGLAGLGSFVWMIGDALASARRRLREPRTAATVTALAGFLGAGLLDLTLMKDWVSLLLFVLLAMLWRLADLTPGDGGTRPGPA